MENNNLQYLFVSQEQASALCELGFSEPCFSFYLSCLDRETNKPVCPLIVGVKPLSNDNLPENVLNAPTKQQVFKFFRDKFNLNAWAAPYMEEDSSYNLFLPDKTYGYFIFKDGIFVADKVDLESNEQAEDECIDKLIKTARNACNTI